MLKITFKFKDQYSHGHWLTQSCECSSIEECKKMYGLGTDPDCEYIIVSIENLDKTLQENK